MPSHYLLTACLLSMCDHVVLLYVVRHALYLLYVMRCTCCTSCVVLVVRRTLYRHTVVWSHRCTVALIWHSPSHGAVHGADRWEFVGGGIAICKVAKLRQLDCVGLHRVRLVMWLTKRGWCPRAGQSASQNVNIHIHICIRICLRHRHRTIQTITTVINFCTMSVFTVSPRFLVSRRTHVVLLYARAHASYALAAILRGGGPAVESAQRTICCLFATSSPSIVHCTLANLRYRPLIFRVFRTSPPPQRAMVVTRLRRASLLVSEPSATRRALGRSRQGSSWWSPPPPGRGKGTGWEKTPVRCLKRARRLPLDDASDRGDSCPKWCCGDDSLPARMQQAHCRGRAISCAGLLACWLVGSLGGSQACWRHFGLSPACLLAWRLSGGKRGGGML